MGTAVQSRPHITAKTEQPVYATTPVHGNSKRQCQIKRDGENCGHRAVQQTFVRDGRIKVEDVIFHCDHPRHIANAHKQITELVKTHFSR